MNEPRVYNHEQQFEGVIAHWGDAAGCRSCNRNTQDPFKGHDGYCPVPAIFALQAERDNIYKQFGRICQAAGNPAVEFGNGKSIEEATADFIVERLRDYIPALNQAMAAEARVRELEAQLANSAEELDSGNAARAELNTLSETMRAYLDSDGIACDWPYDNDNALKAIIEHCKTGWQEWEKAKDELDKLAQPQAGEAKPAGEGGNA